jgi:arginine exporter protein ArgO
MLAQKCIMRKAHAIQGNHSAVWLARPKAWQVLDGLIGLTMWVLSALMVRHAFNDL